MIPHLIYMMQWPAPSQALLHWKLDTSDSKQYILRPEDYQRLPLYKHNANPSETLISMKCFEFFMITFQAGAAMVICIATVLLACWP